MGSPVLSEYSKRPALWGILFVAVTLAFAGQRFVATMDFDPIAGTGQSRPPYPVRIAMPVARPLETKTDDGQLVLNNLVTEIVAGTDSAQSAANDAGRLAASRRESGTTGTEGVFGQPAPSEAFNPLDLDLSENMARADRNRVSAVKRMRLNGQAAGNIKVQVGQQSDLYLDRSSLAAALLEAGNADTLLPPADLAPGLISFAKLRTSGFVVRYDPDTDEITLAKR